MMLEERDMCKEKVNRGKFTSIPSSRSIGDPGLMRI